MTVKEIQDKINRFANENPDLLNEPTVVDGEWLCIAHFIEDEEPNEDNDYAPDGHWDYGKTIMCLPENTGAKYN